MKLILKLTAVLIWGYYTVVYLDDLTLQGMGTVLRYNIIIHQHALLLFTSALLTWPYRLWKKLVWGHTEFAHFLGAVSIDESLGSFPPTQRCTSCIPWHGFWLTLTLSGSSPCSPCIRVRTQTLGLRAPYMREGVLIGRTVYSKCGTTTTVSYINRETIRWQGRIS